MPRDTPVLTSLAAARRRVLGILSGHSERDGLYASGIGYVAFPDSKFRTPQAAAFASARLRHDMEQDGVIVWKSTSRRYFITADGRKELEG